MLMILPRPLSHGKAPVYRAASKTPRFAGSFQPDVPAELPSVRPPKKKPKTGRWILAGLGLMGSTIGLKGFTAAPAMQSITYQTQASQTVDIAAHERLHAEEVQTLQHASKCDLGVADKFGRGVLYQIRINWSIDATVQTNYEKRMAGEIHDMDIKVPDRLFTRQIRPLIEKLVFEAAAGHDSIRDGRLYLSQEEVDREFESLKSMTIHVENIRLSEWQPERPLSETPTETSGIAESMGEVRQSPVNRVTPFLPAETSYDAFSKAETRAAYMQNHSKDF